MNHVQDNFRSLCCLVSWEEHYIKYEIENDFTNVVIANAHVHYVTYLESLLVSVQDFGHYGVLRDCPDLSNCLNSQYHIVPINPTIIRN